MKNLIMRYFTPAESTNEGWEKYSLPIGNGYFGASVFGGTDCERIQFTTNTFANPLNLGGVTSFADIYIDFNHINAEKYERGLDLNRGVAYSSYSVGDTKIIREAFTSYPDKVFAYNINVENGKIDFAIRLDIPYLGDRALDAGGRTGEITIENNVLVMRGTLPSRELIYEARLAVLTDGSVRLEDNKFFINNASKTTVFYTLDTSYKLCEEMFLRGYKAVGDDPHEAVVGCLDNAVSLGWKKLYNRHIDDYCQLIHRVEFDLGGVDDGRSTEQLLESCKEGNNELYLEEVYYAFGRHLLVSSSRKGTPPASLQGVWTVHDESPWGSGFWHNINVQMNYWPAFTTNLDETFLAYVDFWKAYEKKGQYFASEWIKHSNPENFVDGDGECGWIIGTGATCYEIFGQNRNQHSGPGTGAMTAKMFWDYYDFTRDMDILKNDVYPVIHGMSKYLTKCVKKYDDRYLCSFSASPEQLLYGPYMPNMKKPQYYHTVGCAFDQQLIYENACDDVKCAEILGVSDETIEIEKIQLDGYGPVQIGYSGQIKEYDEEHFYGEIGEARHRHISQLVALTPGSSVTHSTPAWLDAARLTLTMRGDQSTGWALAHRFNAWARVGDGEHSYLLLNNLLCERTYPNLWDVHPPFQIDGNFGATAGMTEMVLQSHEGYVSLLPAIPEKWKNISFKGIKARGNFTIDCKYTNGKIENCVIKSEAGSPLVLRYEGITEDTVVKKSDGTVVDFERKKFFINLKTEKDCTYIIENFGTVNRRGRVSEFTSQWTKSGVFLKWDSDNKKCAVFRATDNDSDYILVGETKNDEFVDEVYNSDNRKRLTYKVVVCENGYDSAVDGVVSVLHPASELEEDRYKLRFIVNNKLF